MGKPIVSTIVVFFLRLASPTVIKRPVIASRPLKPASRLAETTGRQVPGTLCLIAGVAGRHVPEILCLIAGAVGRHVPETLCLIAGAVARHVPETLCLIAGAVGRRIVSTKASLFLSLASSIVINRPFIASRPIFFVLVIINILIYKG
jgi:hypothetical protein